MKTTRNNREKLLHVKGLLEEEDFLAAMCNTVATLKELPGYFWVGIYRVVGEELILGPFQGPVACTRIKFGVGVCGTSWKDKKSILVPNVDEFTGHIACNSISRSEMVAPVFDANQSVTLILDVDSDRLDDFSPEDLEFLESVGELISKKLPAKW